ncbi:MAG: HAD hydrolase-like protein [Cyanobacterium sp. T60_A2020_053]|nr:HAD hydrolase-like protein [Cyanobacterium sp. T60_A2020_053]
MLKRVIIFDFDGTIADSLSALVTIANNLALEFGYPQVDEEEILRLSKLSSSDIVQQSPVPFHKIPFVLRRIKKELNKNIADLQPFAGMVRALVSLKEEGYILGIITSNLEENVCQFLHNNDLQSCFDFIYSGTTLFGKHKIINKAIKKHNLQSKDIIYVGDETRDIEAAQKSKIKVIAVTWGFNSPLVLAKYEPDFMVTKPEELTNILIHKTLKVI